MSHSLSIVDGFVKGHAVTKQLYFKARSTLRDTCRERDRGAGSVPGVQGSCQGTNQIKRYLLVMPIDNMDKEQNLRKHELF